MNARRMLAEALMSPGPDELRNPFEGLPPPVQEAIVQAPSPMNEIMLEEAKQAGVASGIHLSGGSPLAKLPPGALAVAVSRLIFAMHTTSLRDIEMHDLRLFCPPRSLEWNARPESGRRAAG